MTKQNWLHLQLYVTNSKNSKIMCKVWKILGEKHAQYVFKPSASTKIEIPPCKSLQDLEVNGNHQSDKISNYHKQKH